MLEGTAYNPARCTLAYVHDPLFSTSPEVTRKVARIWEALYAAGVEVVLSGDDHNYQRFAPQDPNGEADYERGIRQFVVGTGGKNHYAIESPIENLEVYNNDTFGVLKLSLKEDGYEWRFVPVEGKTFTDSGSGNCHGACAQPPLTTDTTAPTVKSTVPAANATGVDPAANLTAAFSEKMDPTTLTKSIFKLFKVNTDGSTTQVTDVIVTPAPMVCKQRSTYVGCLRPCC